MRDPAGTVREQLLVGRFADVELHLPVVLHPHHAPVRRELGPILALVAGAWRYRLLPHSGLGALNRRLLGVLPDEGGGGRVGAGDRAEHLADRRDVARAGSGTYVLAEAKAVAPAVRVTKLENLLEFLQATPATAGDAPSH